VNGDDSYRYPFGPYPTGWYLALESRALAPGIVTPLVLFGRELVAFRSAKTGTAVILDAHCPHMGAHLGYGGEVDGEGIRCPFHHWRFDLRGRCDDVPYNEGRRPPETGLRAWPVHETSGLVLIHYSDSGEAPRWRMPDLPEWGAAGWLGYETVQWRIRMHVQELAENIPDTAHFAYVHEVPGTPRAEVEIAGHVYRQRSYFAETGETFTVQEAHGLGLVWLRSAQVSRSEPKASEDHQAGLVFLTAITPLDAQHCELKLLFLAREEPGARELSPENRALIRLIADTTARDVPIWEHKVYREKPVLVPADGPIAQLRRWARQFYETGANG
jgi:phenylpropionate dioxygenase-like ring-hydroxylating dioxygenase large terminal subunit